MIADLIDQPLSESRRETRTNVFAMATVYTDTSSMPVKLRNLSSTGALAEGPVLPSEGARIRLCRGELEVLGEIVWSKDGSAGIRFEAAVTVADWLPRGRAIAAQQRIDEVVHQARTHSTVAPAPAPPSVPITNVTVMDLLRLKQATESLAEALADDPHVVERHGSRLQVLDLIAQSLRKLVVQHY